MIYALRGNTIRDIALPLEELVVEESGSTVSDYYPTSTDKIEVNMISASDVQTVDVTVDGKYLHWTWLPEVTGLYGIEVKIVQANGTHMRSYRKAQIRVYNSNDQMPDDDGEVEFISEYLVLDAVTVVWVKGDPGNGIVSITKTSTVGLVDTYTITYTESEPTTFTVTNGQDATLDPAQIQEIINDVIAAIDIPTALSDLTEDSTHRTVTDEQITTWNAKGTYSKPVDGIPASDLASGVIPDVSNFITKSVNDLTYYYLKTETYTMAEVNNLIGAIQQFHYEIAASTSAVTNPQSNVLYLIGPTGSGADKYEEYVYTNSTWTKIGDTSIDLSGYVTTTYLNTALAGYQTKIDSSHKLDYSLIANTPTIPSVVDSLSSASTTAALSANQGKVLNDGKQDKIDATHKLSADLVDDASTTNKFVTASEKTTWNGKADKVLVVNHGTDDTTYSVTPNTLHIWGTVASLTLTLATPTDATIVNEYMIQFTSGSTATTLSLPASLSWYGSAPSIEANKTYQISIINNVGIWGGA